jgi:hypothetical protein
VERKIRTCGRHSLTVRPMSWSRVRIIMISGVWNQRDEAILATVSRSRVNDAGR